MTRINRALAAPTLLILLAWSLAPAAQAQSSASQQDSGKTVTITGSTGAGGVKFKGLPGDPVSDAQGNFAIEVPNDLNGYVMPIKEGYAFDPPFVAFGPNSRVNNISFTARVLMFTISGSVGLAGVRMTGLPDNEVTDNNGRYKASAPYGWSGKVQPTKGGYNFSPAFMEYAKITANRDDDNYAAEVKTFRLSGSVGLADVAMRGLPGDPVTDSDGSYAAKVDYGWAGTVTPEREGYLFEPASRRYESLMESKLGQDYKATLRMVTITDRIVLDTAEGQLPVRGVRVTAKPGGRSVITNAYGRYTIEVPYGWMGELVMDKAGYDFSPASVRYDKVTENIDTTASDGLPAGMPYPAAVETIPASSVLVVPTAGVEPEALGEIAEDMRVMLNILREKLSEPRMISGVLQDYGDFFWDSNRAVQGLYIQGHAAVFMLRADFPLAPSTPQPSQTGAVPQEGADPVWQRARTRLYAPPDATGLARAQAQAGRRTFDQFKSDLLQTLRHAANIRHIDPNEWVIVTVTGRGDAGSPAGTGGYGAGGAGGWMQGGGYGGGSAGGGGSFSGQGSFRFSGGASSDPSVTPRRARSAAAPAPTTVLTLQARKADVDAFARGDITAAAFQEKVRTFTY